MTLLLLAAGAGWCCLARDNSKGAAEELRLWLLMLAGVGLAMLARSSGVALAPCMFVAGVGLTLLWAGWRLAGNATSALLRGGDASG